MIDKKLFLKNLSNDALKYSIRVSNIFKKDLKKFLNDDKIIFSMNEVITKLAKGEKLDIKYRDHDLKGNFKGFRECHITPDVLLIYEIRKNELILILARIGSHSDLF